MSPRPPRSTLLPYTTLFRSEQAASGDQNRSIRHISADLLDPVLGKGVSGEIGLPLRDRKSTRLNSSHVSTSYAVFCLTKKKDVAIKTETPTQRKANTVMKL